MLMNTYIIILKKVLNEECLSEARQFCSLYALHNLFSTILIFGEATDV
ncbi:4106_t:CDS:2 [Cetraspora pellucida]|uniref:4106_t:CDS:1 n=1 Tax=Cetraspora pellucida TaxID=1433469 RepID=A0ACA9JY36_9GLOM|nr:4106_t:CDS:2 [Cetraspora pellucida]